MDEETPLNVPATLNDQDASTALYNVRRMVAEELGSV